MTASEPGGGSGDGSILSAVGLAASAFLQAQSWEDCIDDVLASLGRAAGAGRVYLLRNHDDEQGWPTHSLRFEWVRAGVPPHIDDAELRDVPWDGALRRWAKSLTRGEAVVGHVRDFSEAERGAIGREEVRSVAMVPVRVGDVWWGVLGLDACFTERGWSEEEVAALRIVSGALGAAIVRRSTEVALREAEARYRTLIEQIPAIVYIAEVGETGDWRYISPQVESIIGYTPDQWISHPRPFSTHLHPADRDRVMAEEAYSGLTGEPLRSEFRMVAVDGRTVWIRDEAVLIRDESGRPVLWQGVMYDITQQKEAEEQVAFLAYHDKLTGLPNRVMFEELLELAMNRGRRSDLAVSVVYLDLDNFKLVNDSLGHAAGDQLLQLMGMRLREAIRDSDIVARHGGDEFLILLSDVERGNFGTRPEAENSVVVVQAVAERIHDALRAPFVIGDTEFYITASIGVSLFPFDSDDPKVLLKNADAAMYRSKRTGPGGTIFFSTDTVDPLTKLSLTTRLRRAVERKEWLLHYQPVLDLHDGHLVSVEALLRWPDPNGGMTPPGEFIPLAEEMGLIEAIGDWVVEEVCRQSKAWRTAGLMVEISFNLSPRQLWQSSLVRSILGQLQYAKVSPRHIVVEITESSAMTDPDRTMRVLDELHQAGLRLAIDDFGTGYSSLARLKQMPVDILKVDRTFVRDVPHDPHAASMVRAIIQMALGLGMTPLAEGIETEEQWRFLAAHGCQLGQGYYFSRPVPAEDIIQRYVWGVLPQAN